MIESPGEGEEEGEAPDDGQPPVAVTELGPDMERGGDHLGAGGAQDLTKVLIIDLIMGLSMGLKMIFPCQNNGRSVMSFFS